MTGDELARIAEELEQHLDAHPQDVEMIGLALVATIKAVAAILQVGAKQDTLNQRVVGALTNELQRSVKRGVN